MCGTLKCESAPCPAMRAHSRPHTKHTPRLTSQPLGSDDDDDDHADADADAVLSSAAAMSSAALAVLGLLLLLLLGLMGRTQPTMLPPLLCPYNASLIA